MDEQLLIEAAQRDSRAMETVKKWKFEPAMKDGRPVAVQVNIEVNFHLY